MGDTRVTPAGLAILAAGTLALLALGVALWVAGGVDDDAPVVRAPLLPPRQPRLRAGAGAAVRAGVGARVSALSARLGAMVTIKEGTMPHHTDALENTAPSDKVTAATVAGSGMGAVGAALATVILWGLQHYTHVAVSEPVAAALPVVLTAVLAGLGALVAGYRTPENHPAPSAVQAVHEQGLK